MRHAPQKHPPCVVTRPIGRLCRSGHFMSSDLPTKLCPAGAIGCGAVGIGLPKSTKVRNWGRSGINPQPNLSEMGRSLCFKSVTDGNTT